MDFKRLAREVEFSRCRGVVSSVGFQPRKCNRGRKRVEVHAGFKARMVEVVGAGQSPDRPAWSSSCQA